MATTLNPSLVIPNIQVQAPDFNMLTKAAASVQGRYLEGFNKYKSTINSLLNANITSDDNKKFRSEYFKKVDSYLNNLGGIDFSNPANVSVADTLIDPLVKDKEFIYDLNFSTMQAAERSKLDQVRSSTDEKVFSQYSPTMEAAMSYAEQDMKNTKRGDGSMYKISPQKFVPFVNIQNVLNDAAIKQKLQIKEDRLTGAYIVTDVNGNQAVGDFTNWARLQLGETYNQQLLVTGKVAIRQQLDSLMQSNPNLTREQAYQQIAKDNSLAIYSNHQEYKSSLDSNVANIDIELRKIKSKYKNFIPKGSQDEQNYNYLTQLKTEKQKELADLNANQSDKDSQLKNTFQQFMNNPEYAILPYMKDGLAKSWAKSYAMTTAEHSIKVNQKALQEDAQAWDKFMADYNYAIFEKEEMFKLGISKDKALFDAQLDFEKQLNGLGSGTEGSSGASTGRLTQGPSELLVNDQTPYEMYQNRLSELQQTAIANYLDDDVLAAATNNAENISYNTAASNLKIVMQDFNTYGNPGSANYRNASPEYKQAYQESIKFLQKINGNVKVITLAANIPDIIFKGVQNYKELDPLKWRAANDKIQKGARSFNEYARLKTEENKKLAQAKKEGFITDKYWEKDEKTGRYVPRKNLSGWVQSIIPNWIPGTDKAEFTEADRNAFYQAIVPDYEKFKNKTAERSTTLQYSGGKNFDYTALGELIGRAKKIEGIGEDGVLVKTTDDKNNPLVTFQNKYRNLGSQLSEYFGSDLKIAKLPNGDLQVEVPFKADKEKIILKEAEKDVTGRSAKITIDKADANELWQSLGQGTLGGRQFNFNRYGDLAKVNDYFNPNVEEAYWITNGFASTINRVDLPKNMTTHGIENGYLSFSDVNDRLYISLTVNNRTQDYPTEITKSQYKANPEAMSATINELVLDGISKIQNSIFTEKQRQSQQLDEAIRSNPDGYINTK